jgi:hypothetical protein
VDFSTREQRVKDSSRTSSAPPKKPKKGAPEIIRRIVKEDIRIVYEMKKLIGTGNFGTVRLASPWSNPSKLYAIKSIPKDKVVGDEIQMLE